MKVLVIGSTGKTGHELCMLLKEKNIPYDAPGRKELDLAYPEQIQSCLKHYKPDIVVNAASYI